jgi:hypothetical protein
MLIAEIINGVKFEDSSIINNYNYFSPMFYIYGSSEVRLMNFTFKENT